MLPLKPDFLAMLGSLPGIDAEALSRALEVTPPSVGVRLNSRKFPMNHPIAGIPFEQTESVGWCVPGRYLPSRPSFTLDPLLHAGAYYVQDPSSMVHRQIVERIVAISGDKPLSLLDFCAAPGGKTTAMADALPWGSAVVANEFSPQRGKALRENLEKWGYPFVITTGTDSHAFSTLPPLFDIVAVDAPCSGEGMMRKDETARSQWSEKLTSDCATLQREILSDIVESLKPGGFLIYSTCTFNTLENEENAKFITSELNLRSVEISHLELVGIENCGHALAPDVEALRFMPHLTCGEGLFVALFQKPDLSIESENSILPPIAHLRHNPVSSMKKKKSNPSKQDSKDSLSKEEMTLLQSWFSIPMDFIISGDIISALPQSMNGLYGKLKNSGINVTAAGLPAAFRKGRSLAPDSRICLNLAFMKDTFPTLDLPLDETLAFLRHQPFPIPPSLPKGFTQISYAGLPLGIVNNLGSRANNLLPSSWRIKI